MAKRLTKLEVDEVSVVDKGANNRRFLILKQANPDSGPEDQKSIKKAGRPSLFGRAKHQTAAGTSGPLDGGTQMTPEDVRKAVAEAGDEIMAPLDERIQGLEEAVAKLLSPDESAIADEPEEEAPEALTAETVAKIVADAVAPLAERLGAVESASGARQSGREEQGAHTVRKADGSFSWEGSGLLL